MSNVSLLSCNMFAFRQGTKTPPPLTEDSREQSCESGIFRDFLFFFAKQKKKKKTKEFCKPPFYEFKKHIFFFFFFTRIIHSLGQTNLGKR